MWTDTNRRDKMPAGPNGQRRPAGVVSAAVMVAKITTGEINDNKKAKFTNAKSGLAYAKVRTEYLIPEARSEIVRKTAAARWT